ncbi:MAG TPA: hypothetical protein VGA09_23215 [Candidatus Binatia bacterium]
MGEDAQHAMMGEVYTGYFNRSVDAEAADAGLGAAFSRVNLVLDRRSALNCA